MGAKQPKVSAHRSCNRQSHCDEVLGPEIKKGSTVFETDLLTPMTGEDARLAIRMRCT
jgi:hypothetical protein